MLTFFENLNPLILDVAIVAILVLVAFFGAIRGIKKVSINVLLLSIALFLGFCSYTNSLKVVIEDKLINMNSLVPAGSDDVFKFAASLLSPLILSLVLFLLFYLVMKAVVTLIMVLIKRKRKAQPKPKSVVGRVFGGLLSLVYGAALLIVLLLSVNNNIVGTKVAIDNSTVTKFVVDNSEKLLSKIDDKLTDKIVIKVYNGDVLFNVENRTIESFNYIDDKVKTIVMNTRYMEALDDGTLTKAEVENMVKERLNDLSNLAVVSNSFENGSKLIKNNFVGVADDWIVLISKSVENAELGKVKFGIQEIAAIRKNLVDAGVGEKTIAILDGFVTEI